MLGGGHIARVPASGPNSNRPFDGSALGWAFHVPVARLQLTRMATLPSAASVIVYCDASAGFVVPWASSMDWNSTSRQDVPASWLDDGIGGAGAAGGAGASGAGPAGWAGPPHPDTRMAANNGARINEPA